MSSTYSIDGRLYSFMIDNGAAGLGRHRDTVNRLNVFPIPDGDTGDNMYLTIRSGAAASGEGADLGQTAANISGGMLPGAHGNSGVILSRIFYGIARGLEGVTNADVGVFGQAMLSGVKEAYGAVDTPVEGTILTVCRESVEAAVGKSGPETTFEEFFRALVEESRKSLERTPELLETLKEAGVVDSGGAGLMYIFEGMLGAVEGKKIEYSDESHTNAAALDFSTFDENSVLEFGYCTEFILRLTKAKTDIDSFDDALLFKWLSENGESVVCFRDGTLVKVHVHTFRPGQILEYAGQFGEFLTVKIENMSLQHSENIGRGGHEDAPDVDENGVRLKLDRRKHHGIVAVANGEGVRGMFMDLGCDAVVDGGQSMNPSAGDFVDAFKKINAETIYVFPNNSNIILAAKQAAELYSGSRIEVIPSKTVGEGYAAVSMIDFENGDAESVAAEAAEIMDGVDTGFVSRASRDASGEVAVTEGDYIGFSGKKILTDNPSREEAALALADALDAGTRDVLIVIRGADVAESESERLCGLLASRYPRTEIVPTFGGQPVHDYILVFE